MPANRHLHLVTRSDAERRSIRRATRRTANERAAADALFPRDRRLVVLPVNTTNERDDRLPPIVA